MVKYSTGWRVATGDPLYIRVFFLHRAQEAILDQNECVFLQKKTPVMSVNPGKKLNLGEQIFFGAQGGQFCDL